MKTSSLSASAAHPCLALLAGAFGLLCVPATAAVVSSFAGGGSALLSDNGQGVVVNGGFVDFPGFTPTTNPAYAGIITASALYSETVSSDASVTVSGEPASLKFASGAGTAFTSSSDWSVSMTISFAGIGTGGFLPTGSWINILDLDGNSINGPVGSRLYGMTAYDSTGTPITSPWLSSFMAGDYGADPTSPGQPSPSYPTDFPTVSQVGGVYNYQAAVTATATPVIAAQLLQDVRAIRFDYFGASLDNTQITFSDFAPTAVPEPTSGVIVGLFGLFLLRRRRSC
ncbi:MAG: hypothetical protein EOP84_21175 [Verrucomicrobiaceae bacterium]|nr:MAG: hypothetical protein EOP84_21175 [Verrucomicrobiaceae bacterium]